MMFFVANMSSQIDEEANEVDKILDSQIEFRPGPSSGFYNLLNTIKDEHCSFPY